MTTAPNPEQGPSSPADEQTVDQTAGRGQALAEGSGDDGAGAREVGVTAAVERGPAELSSDGDPVPDNPHIALEDREPARSTDELPSDSQG